MLICRISESSNSTIPYFIVSDIRGVQKFKMAAYKPEVLISQLVDEIEESFQWLPPIFRVEQLNSTIVHYTQHKGSLEIQDGGLQTGSTYISACRRDRNAISRATPHFRGRAVLLATP